MTPLAETIASLEVRPGSLAIFWLGQAGFAFKTSAGQLIFIDAYLSNSCEFLPGGGVTSKRMIPTPLEATEVTSGMWLATHRHQDHLDDPSVSAIAKRAPDVHFGGPASCVRALREDLRVPAERTHLLQVGHLWKSEGFSLRAVYADHGESQPDAVGIVIEADGVKVYHTGDTSYCPDRMEEVITLRPDVIIPCINGTYGNMDGIEAARLANEVGASVAIPSHFWFFIGQNRRAEGMPAAFLEACEAHAPDTAPVMLMVGEPYVFKKG
jgi:L-ascorbate 6-phosphate lactonase